MTEFCTQKYCHCYTPNHPICKCCPVYDKNIPPEEIRYYMGKYKVRLLPKIVPKHKPNCRVFIALEEIPCDTIGMMINPNGQYMTQNRYLQKKLSEEAKQ